MVAKRKADPASSASQRESLLNADDTVTFVGSQIRKLRSERSLTLQQLSDEAGVSSSLLSLMERGKTSPSIASLVAVASALGVHVSDLFDNRAPQDVGPVRRQTEQPLFKTTDGITRRIAVSDHDQGVEMFCSEYRPGAGTRSSPLRYSGVDYGIVLEGSLLVEVDGQRYELNRGDSISYGAEAPHRIQNPTKKTARVVWVKLERRSR